MFNFFSELKKDLAIDNALLGNYNIINMSNKVLYIEGHKGVVCVDKQHLSFKVNKKLINIFGENLTLKKITDSTALIEGNIKSVETQ